MAVDYTRLIQKLVPEQDGEAGLTLRTATVDNVNADGTVDLEMSSGVIVPNVPRLDGARAYLGTVVQVLSLRGSLLVIGSVGGDGPELFNSVEDITNSSFTSLPAGTELAVLFLPNKTYKANTAYRVVSYAQYTVGTGSSVSTPLAVFRKTNAAGALLINPGRFLMQTTNGMGYVREGIFTVGSADVTAVIAMTISVPQTGETISQRGGVGAPRTIYVYRAGRASDYPNQGVLS